MNLSEQLAKHLKEVHFGGNWTWVNMKDTLADVTWQQATAKPGSLNTIATLTFHINYFVGVVIRALKEQVLEGNDKLSFDHPPINGAEDWDAMRDKLLADAETFAGLVSELAEEKLGETFFQEKYGTYFRNIVGIMEHTHYHMGQIVVKYSVSRCSGSR